MTPYHRLVYLGQSQTKTLEIPILCHKRFAELFVPTEQFEQNAH